jgi:MraZ protein
LAFTGTFDHTLDAKNRLTVPARFRSVLSGTIVLAKGFETCLAVYPQETYKQLTDAALAGLNPFSPQARELKRHFHGNAMETELDSAGRINLPAGFLEYAKLGREVVVTGTGDCLEIWDRDAWQSYDSDLTARAADHIASLGHPA